ncbi:MAG: EAL domain-containing protein, partial [Nevskiales bacterium]
HALFMERLHQVIVACQRESHYFAVVQLALPELAEITRTLGNEAGDLLLKAVADRLSATVRSIDTVARLNGNEYTLIMTGLKEPQDISGTLDRLRLALSKPLRVGFRDIPVKPCFGAALYPDDGDTPDLLLRHAEVAQREAATKGPGNTCLYHAVLAAHAIPAPATGPFEQLREAQTRGGLGIELQALTDVRTRQVVGAEVLLAWRYPGRPGLLRTAEQVLQASASDALAAAVSYWALERACDQQASWRDLELPSLPLMMNLSALPLAGRRNEQALHRLLARYRVPPEQLIMMVNMDTLESLLLEPGSELPMLRDLGMRIGVNNVDPARIDLLRRADVDVVQLTPRNIIGLPGSREAADQSAAIVQAGQRVGAQIFASGVERAEQREALLALGCHIQQGRLFGEPLEPREFTRSLMRVEVGTI